MASFDFYHFEWFESEAEHLLRCVSLWVSWRDFDFLLKWHGLPLLDDAFVWVPVPHFPVANSSIGSVLDHQASGPSQRTRLSPGHAPAGSSSVASFATLLLLSSSIPCN